MGLSSAVSRGHMRPFGGRSPPFLVATLCVGLCVLAVSYWRLGIQYNDLEEQLRRLIQKKDSLEANESFINKQLELREENFSEAKVSLQKKEQELIDLRKKFDEDVAKLKETQKSLDDLKQSLAVFKTESQAKETSLQELRDRNSALEKENAKLKTDYTEVKTKLDSAVAAIAAAASKSDKKESLNEAANAPVKSKAEQAQINLDRAQSTNVIQPPPDNHNKYGKNDGVSPSDENGVKHDDKNSLNKPSSEHEQHPQEQIQKPKIDPVVKFLKNSDQNANNNDDEDDVGNGGGGGNPPGSKQQAKSDLRENNNNYVDDEKDGAVKPDSGNFNNNMDDKDSVLDSNNFEENI